jgi:hypothetical protein
VSVCGGRGWVQVGGGEGRCPTRPSPPPPGIVPVDVVDAGAQLGDVAVALVQQLQAVARSVHLRPGGRRAGGDGKLGVRSWRHGKGARAVDASSPGPCERHADTQTGVVSPVQHHGSLGPCAPARRAQPPGLPGWRARGPRCRCAVATAAAGPQGSGGQGGKRLGEGAQSYCLHRLGDRQVGAAFLVVAGTAAAGARPTPATSHAPGDRAASTRALPPAFPPRPPRLQQPHDLGHARLCRLQRLSTGRQRAGVAFASALHGVRGRCARALAPPPARARPLTIRPMSTMAAACRGAPAPRRARRLLRSRTCCARRNALAAHTVPSAP